MAWNREVGVELGAVTVSTILTFGAITLCMAIGFVLTVPDVPVLPFLLVVGAVGLLTPIIVYPFSYTLWLAIDLAMHPPETAELNAAADAVREAEIGRAETGRADASA